MDIKNSHRKAREAHFIAKQLSYLKRVRCKIGRAGKIGNIGKTGRNGRNGRIGKSG